MTTLDETSTSRRTTWQAHTGAVLDDKDGFQVVACEACGFRHIVPLPTPAELAEVYRHDYYATEKPLYLQRSEEDRPWWERVFAERLASFEERFPARAESRRVLDLGSGPGLFLDVARARGWRAVGVEPSRQAAAHARARGHEVVEAFLAPELVPSLGRFDAIHLNEVLEHLPDPAAHLALCRELLVPGGQLCIAVPNDYNPFQDALRRALDYAPWWVAPPHHVNYFDFDTLEALLTRVGFEPLRREATFPIDLFLLMGEDYVADDEAGRRCHARRKAFEENLERAGLGALRRDLYGKLAELGLGRQAVLLARRAA